MPAPPRKQISVILKKNLTLMRRNKGELAVDVITPLYLMGVIVLLGAIILKNEEIPGKLLNDDIAIGGMPSGSYFGLAPSKNVDCSDSPLKGLYDFLATNHPTLNFTCVEDDQQLKSIRENIDIKASFDFNKPESLAPGSAEPVTFNIRLPPNQMAFESYSNYTKSYRAPQSSAAEQFSKSFLSYQIFMTDVISQVKFPSVKSPIKSVKVKQYPYEKFVKDDRLDTLSMLFPFYMVLIFGMPVVSQIRRLLEERETRFQETMFMAGLLESIWYITWAITLICRNIIVGLILGIVSKLVLLKTDISVIIVSYIPVCIVSAAFCMAISSFFDKADSGSGVVLLVFLFGAAPWYLIRPYIDTFWYCVLAFLWPPMGIIGIPSVLINADATVAHGVSWTQFFDPNVSDINIALGPIVICVAIACIFWFFFGYYLNKVVKRSFGQHESCCFCLDPARCQHSKVYNDNRDFSEVDDMESDSIEKVSDEVKAREGVRVFGLKKEFPPPKKGGKPTVAVNGFSSAFYEGHITALLGHNGAGKSTLISVLTGLYEPTEGDSNLYGHSLRHELSLVRNNLGVCSQQNVLVPLLTVEESIKLFGELRDVPADTLKEKVEAGLKEVGLLEKRGALTSTLSGGMKRRLCVAMAFIGDPKIMFLDEPTSGMDPVSRRDIWTLLEKKKKDRVIVLCTHFMDEADFLGDRIIVMSHGHLQVAGTSLFLKSRFGLGYHLHVDKKRDASDSNIMKLVKHRIPNAELEESSRLNMKILLPRECVNSFADLLDELDSNKDELNIEGAGMSASTLEEVFLKLAQEAESESAMKSQMGEIQDDKSPDDMIKAIRASSKSLLGDQNEKTSKGERTTPTTPTSPTTEFPVVDPIPSAGSQLSVLMWKRAKMGKRQKKEITQMLIAPIMMTVISMMFYLFPSLFTGIISSSSLYLSPQSMKAPDGINDLPYIYHDSPSKTFIESITKDPYYPSSMPGVPAPFDFTSSVDKTNETDIASALLTRGRTTALVELESPSAGAVDMRMWFNTSFSAVLPSMTSVLYSSYYNSMTSGKNADEQVSIQANYRVMPTKSDEMSEDDIFAIVFFSISSMYLCMGYIIAPVYSAVAIAKERVSQARLQQRLMGVKAVYYWISCLIWDYVILLIPMILYVVLTILAERIFGKGSTEVILPGLIIIFLFILSGTCIAYILQHFFRSASSVEQNLMNYIMPIILVSMLLNLILGFIKDVDVLEFMKYALRLVPYFAFMNGMSEVYSAASSNIILPEPLKLNMWSWDVSGKSFVFLVIDGIICFVLLLFIEKRSWVKTGAVSYDMSRIEPNDSDVADEIKRVESGGQQNAISVTHLWKLFPKKQTSEEKKNKSPPQVVEACRDVTFGVQPGDCFGMIGPNGAGKTSLLSILMGTLGFNQGACKVSNYNIPSQVEQAYRTIGYCPQFDVLFDFLTVYECLYFYGRVKGIPQDALSDVIIKSLDCLDLTEHKDKLTKDLSGGNKRRLCTAIAFLGNPSVVIMDEPSTGLDPVSRRKLWNIVKHSSNERSFLLTTHLMEEADALCNRITIMVNGQIMCLGSGQHLKTRYGQGYSLDIKLENDPMLMDKLYELLKSECGSFTLRESHGCHAILVLPTNRKLSDLFRIIEHNRESLKVVDYTLAQASLDQILMHFARNQREEEAEIVQK